MSWKWIANERPESQRRVFARGSHDRRCDFVRGADRSYAGHHHGAGFQQGIEALQQKIADDHAQAQREAAASAVQELMVGQNTSNEDSGSDEVIN